MSNSEQNQREPGWYHVRETIEPEKWTIAQWSPPFGWYFFGDESYYDDSKIAEVGELITRDVTVSQEKEYVFDEAKNYAHQFYALTDKELGFPITQKALFAIATSAYDAGAKRSMLKTPWLNRIPFPHEPKNEPI